MPGTDLTMDDLYEPASPVHMSGLKIHTAPASPKGRDGGPKSCTICHTTRTPQWREGPAGEHHSVVAPPIRHSYAGPAS